MNQEPRLLQEPSEGVPEIIDTLRGYQEYCRRLANATGPLAADAERASGFRYSHDDWLVQFKRNGAGIGLLDPVALQKQGVNWDELNDAVGSVPWIIHDAAQDLPGFFALGFMPRQLFDTELSARLLGLDRFGLSSVTEHYLGLRLAKEHSAADWSYRPIPRDWRNYAALDVELLIELAECMRADLQKQGKLAWAQEEFMHILNEANKPKEAHPRPWLRISHISVLMHDPVGLLIAKSLWYRRDELARGYDIAPSLLLPDAAIIAAGKLKPRNIRSFRSIRILNERVRIHTGSDQDKMFERYAPIQRKIRPSVWKAAIDEALIQAKAGQDALWLDTTINKTQDLNQDNSDQQAAPRSMRYWRDHHPQRYERLQRVKAALGQLSERTHTPVEVLIKPQIIRNLCWTDDVRELDVVAFLIGQGARQWQVDLLAESVTRVIM